MDPPIEGSWPYSRWEIARLQLTSQEKVLIEERARIFSQLGPDSGERDWRLYEELGILQAGLEEALRMHLREAKSLPTWWDKLLIRVYKWAVKGRLDDGG